MLCTCETGTLQLEPSLQLFFWVLFLFWQKFTTYMQSQSFYLRQKYCEKCNHSQIIELCVSVWQEVAIAL
jgi:hypothetical protein